MGMFNMMQQAQKMQKRLQAVQDELANTELSSQSGGGAVEVIVNGQSKFKSIKLKPEALNPENPRSVDTETLEMLEDLITQAILSAQEKASGVMEEKMKTVTGGLKIPGLF
jgi:DNA-binding YbaB/EbfC family protein